MNAPAGKKPVTELPPGRPPERTEIGAVVLDRPATLRDLDRLPRTWRGEILRGTMYAFPRPRAPHQFTCGALHGDLRDPFGRGRGGPGGWWILSEPGIQLPASQEVSPDVAGWRRERLPSLPSRGAIPIAPDWACEVLSPRTRAYDLVIKRRFYAEIGVPYLWYVEPIAKLITAHKLISGQWVDVGAWQKDERARIEPFDAVELGLAEWWAGVAGTPEDEDEPESPPPPSSESTDR